MTTPVRRLALSLAVLVGVLTGGSAATTRTAADVLHVTPSAALPGQHVLVEGSADTACAGRPVLIEFGNSAWSEEFSRIESWDAGSITAADGSLQADVVVPDTASRGVVSVDVPGCSWAAGEVTILPVGRAMAMTATPPLRAGASSTVHVTGCLGAALWPAWLDGRGAGDIGLFIEGLQYSHWSDGPLYVRPRPGGAVDVDVNVPPNAEAGAAAFSLSCRQSVPPGGRGDLVASVAEPLVLLHVAAPDRVVTGGRVSLVGTLRHVDGRRIAGRVVRLYRRGAVERAWTSVGRGVTDVSGRVTFRDTPSMSAAYRLLVRADAELPTTTSRIVTVDVAPPGIG